VRSHASGRDSTESPVRLVWGFAVSLGHRFLLGDCSDYGCVMVGYLCSGQGWPTTVGIAEYSSLVQYFRALMEQANNKLFYVMPALQ
jgi:hypothetical protein